MIPKAPDIPYPRLEDKGYMDLWHKYLDKDQQNFQLESQRDTWRKAFFITAAIMMLSLSLTIALLSFMWGRYITI